MVKKREKDMGLLPHRNAGQPLSGDETVSQRMSGHLACPLVHMMLFVLQLWTQLEVKHVVIH